MEELAGKDIKHYYIEAKVNEGGMGEVYRAIDKNLNRKVAIKVISQKLEDINSIERFKNEAYMASKLDHQNICTIIEIDKTDDGFYYIVMLWNDGQTLSEILKERALSIEETLNYMRQCFLGLGAAHKRGILHLDIKPGNLMINSEGNLKIVDFGLSRLEREIPAFELDEFYGTTAYLSPEQAIGKPVDNRTDIWSAGIVFYECLTGQVPFKGDYEEAIMYSIVNEEPIKPSQINPEVPELLDNIVLKCLEKKPDKRYHSCEDIIKDIDNFIRGEYSKTREIEIIDSQKLDVKEQSEWKLLRKFSKTQLLYLSLFTFLIFFLVLYFITNYLTSDDKDFAGDDLKRVAILKFEFINPQEGDEAFAKGFTYYLSDNLTQLQNYGKSVSIISPNEIFENNIKTLDMAEKKFNANYALSGTFERDGVEIKLSLRFYDRNMVTQRTRIIKDLRRRVLEDSAFSIVADMLGIDYTLVSKKTQIQTPRTTNEKAYNLTMQGWGYLGRYEKIENINKAINSFREAIQNDDNFALAYAGLSEAYWLKYDLTYDPNEAKLAEQNSIKAFELEPEHHQTLMAMGQTYIQKGEYDKAIDIYSKILKSNPSNPKALLHIANAYEYSNQFDLAEKNFKAAIKFDSLEWSKYNNLGVFYSERGQFDKAEEMFKKVIELTKDNDRGYNNLGGIYIRQLKFNEAIKYFNKSIQINSLNPDSYNNRAVAYFQLNKFKEAAEDYEKALKITGPNYRYYGNLAETYYQMKDKKKEIESWLKAIEKAEEAIKINPKNSHALSSLSLFNAFLGQKNKSEKYIEAALSNSPNTPMILLNTAICYETFGDRDKALEYIKKFILANGQKSDIFFSKRLINLREDPRFKEIIK